MYFHSCALTMVTSDHGMSMSASIQPRVAPSRSSTSATSMPSTSSTDTVTTV
ncbi:hypothetical protein DEI96_003915 [Curtobacterium sp. MCLR17_031]|uniref:hypothetical protein n=1 Tax=Curtobacterium sp. MCLR17_031 TaxID=2175622 RepID=UPI0024DF6596|nr:hypothetical protein [Curtobacterium sp. MCLR17_031]WIE58780.1 hypothetical protein DEI96_003915 [Curtobacterium sp. MCLR17_031]